MSATTARLREAARSDSEEARNGVGAEWITDELIVETKKVWRPYFGAELSRGEAVEILRNVGRLMENLAA